MHYEHKDEICAEELNNDIITQGLWMWCHWTEARVLYFRRWNIISPSGGAVALLVVNHVATVNSS